MAEMPKSWKTNLRIIRIFAPMLVIASIWLLYTNLQLNNPMLVIANIILLIATTYGTYVNWFILRLTWPGIRIKPTRL